MQTKSIIASASMAALATAAAIQNTEMPTLGGPNWYDWSATASSAVAVATSAVSTQWGQWTPAAISTPSYSASASSWSQWTPSAVAVVTTTSAPYENPFTIYTTMTDSRGVITGMPSVVTSQPSVVTSQPTQPVPAGVSSSSVVPKVVSASTLVTVSSSTSATGFQQSKTASASIATHTGAASSSRVGSAGLIMVVLGCAFALL